MSLLHNCTAVLITAVLVFGCNDGALTEETPTLHPDIETATVASTAIGGEPISLSLEIVSSQSWGARITSAEGAAIDWIAADTVEGLNLDGTPKTWTVTLTFDNNPGFTPRDAVMHFSSADCEADVRISQKGKDPIIVIDKTVAPIAVNYRDCVASISFDASCPWIAEVEGDLGDAVLDKTEGTEADNCINVSFSRKTVWEDLRGKVTIRLKDYEVADEIEIVQSGGVVWQVPFSPLSSTYDIWTPAMPSKASATDYVSGTHTWTPLGLQMSFGNSNGSGLTYITNRGNTYLCFDRTGSTVGWVKVHCPEGRTIKYLEVHAVNTAQKSFGVYDNVADNGARGNVLGASAKSDVNTPIEWGTEALPWTQAPERGQNVTLCVVKSKSTMIDYLAVSIE